MHFYNDRLIVLYMLVCYVFFHSHYTHFTVSLNFMFVIDKLRKIQDTKSS